MHAIFEKIRYQGKIKIVNRLNNNPKHPEYQSSFPDLLTVTPKSNNQNDHYPFVEFDETFDSQGRKNIIFSNKNFKERMNKSVQDFYYKEFVNNDLWQVSDQSNSSSNIKSTIKYFQKNYENSKLSNQLDKDFMNDLYPSLFVVDNNFIFPDIKHNMIEDFKKKIPDIQLQKLIATYANQKFIYQSYRQLISEYPDIYQYHVKNSRNLYKIDNLEDGSVKLVATNLSDLVNTKENSNSIPKCKSFGIRATIIFPKNSSPIMKYSHIFK